MKKSSMLQKPGTVKVGVKKGKSTPKKASRANWSSAKFSKARKKVFGV